MNFKHSCDRNEVETKCGRAQKFENTQSSNADIGYDDNDDVRIVNGYNAPQRPWIALIVFGESFSDTPCGGSLLNQRYDIFSCFIEKN